MTILQFIVTYITCWWLVLFMVLPHEADAPKTPGVGHAPSAPANPQLKKKMKWTTLLAIIPAAVLYLIVSAAHAEDSIYHAGSGGCKPLENYHAPADLNVRDGFGTGGRQVKPATLGGNSAVGNFDHVEIPLEIPSQKYLEPQGGTSNHNVDMSQSFIQGGRLGVNQDGTATLNGQPIAPQSTDCQ